MPTNVTEIKNILTPEQLQALRDAWGDTTAQREFKKAMGGLLPGVYPTSRQYVDAVAGIFYGTLPPDNAPPPRDLLSERDRERCIIALLAGSQINSNIALHMYIAMMLEVAPSEIAHILLLAGVYSGVHAFADGLQMEERLLLFLKQRFDPNDPTKPIDSIAPDQLFEPLRKTLDGPP